MASRVEEHDLKGVAKISSWQTQSSSWVAMDSNTVFDGGQRAKGRGKSWSLEETADLVLCRKYMDAAFKHSVHSNQIHLWEEISTILNSKYQTVESCRSPTACKSKWKHIRHEYRRIKEEGSSIEGYFKQVQNIVEDSEVEPEVLSAETNSMPDTQPAQADDNQIYAETATQLHNNNCPCNSQKLDVGSCASTSNYSGPNQIGSRRSIAIHNGYVIDGVCIDETATAQSIEEDIKVRFQLEYLEFYLEDEDEVVRPVDKNMPTNKIYHLHVGPNSSHH